MNPLASATSRIRELASTCAPLPKPPCRSTNDRRRRATRSVVAGRHVDAKAACEAVVHQRSRRSTRPARRPRAACRSRRSAAAASASSPSPVLRALSRSASSRVTTSRRTRSRSRRRRRSASAAPSTGPKSGSPDRARRRRGPTPAPSHALLCSRQSVIRRTAAGLPDPSLYLKPLFVAASTASRRRCRPLGRRRQRPGRSRHRRTTRRPCCRSGRRTPPRCRGRGPGPREVVRRSRRCESAMRSAFLPARRQAESGAGGHARAGAVAPIAATPSAIPAIRVQGCILVTVVSVTKCRRHRARSTVDTRGRPVSYFASNACLEGGATRWSASLAIASSWWNRAIVTRYSADPTGRRGGRRRNLLQGPLGWRN